MNKKTSNRQINHIYEDLANGVIIQALDDLVWSMAMIPPGKMYKYQRNARRAMRVDVEAFLGNEWYLMLTNLPESIIKKRAYSLKAIDREQNWLQLLCKARLKDSEDRKKIDMDYAVSTKHHKVIDNRKKEYKNRVRLRTKRIKNEERRRKDRWQQ